MKRNVYTDGNGSSLIQVEGMGVYVPASELEAAQAKIAQLQNDVLAKRIAELTGERDALAAQVEQLRESAQEAANALGFLSFHLRGRIGEAALMDIAEKADTLQGALDATPAQCLTEIKAQAVEEYCASFESMCVNQLDGDDVTQDMADGWKAGIMDCRIAGRKYANQLRQQAKGE